MLSLKTKIIQSGCDLLFQIFQPQVEFTAADRSRNQGARRHIGIKRKNIEQILYLYRYFTIYLYRLFFVLKNPLEYI